MIRLTRRLTHILIEEPPGCPHWNGNALRFLPDYKLLGGLQPNLPQASFNDQAQISSWALDAVSTFSSRESGSVKLMNGTNGNPFFPKATYTREQSFLTIHRLSNYLS